MSLRLRLGILAGALMLAVVAVCGESNRGYGGANASRPWYPSLDAFEHDDSGRSHLFPQRDVRRTVLGEQHR